MSEQEEEPSNDKGEDGRSATGCDSSDGEKDGWSAANNISPAPRKKCKLKRSRRTTPAPLTATAAPPVPPTIQHQQRHSPRVCPAPHFIPCGLGLTPTRATMEWWWPFYLRTFHQRCCPCRRHPLHQQQHRGPLETILSYPDLFQEQCDNKQPLQNRGSKILCTAMHYQKY